MTRAVFAAALCFVLIVLARGSGHACKKGIHCHSVAQVARAMAQAERLLLHRRSAEAGRVVLSTFPRLHRLGREKVNTGLRRHGAHILAVAARRARGVFTIEVGNGSNRRDKKIRIPARWTHLTLERLQAPWAGYAGAVFVQGSRAKRKQRLGKPPHEQKHLVALLAEPDPGLRLAATMSLQHALTSRPCAKAKPRCPPPKLVVAALVARLADPVVSVRHAAARALASIGPAPSPRLGALAALAKDPATIVRIAASQAMGTHARKRPALVSALLAQLASSDVEMKEIAAEALARHVAPLPTSMLPQLIRYLEAKRYRAPYHESLHCRSIGPFKLMALRVLAAMGPRAAPATKALAGLLDRGWHGFEVRQVLVSIGPSVIPDLRRVLGGTDHHAKREAIYGLASLGKQHPSAIPPVIACLDDKDADLRDTAVRALIHYCGPKAVVPLCGGLRSKEPRVRLHSAKALAGLGPHAARCAPPLISLLGGPADDQAQSALEAAGPQVVPALTRALEHHSTRIRRGAAQTLARFGPKARPAMASLRKLLGDPDPGVRAGAATALGRIGPGARSATDALLQAVQRKAKHRDRWRVQAIEALGRIGVDRADVIAALTAILAGRTCGRVGTDGTVVSTARALGRIGNKTPGVLRSLRGHLGSINAVCRASAAWALANLGVHDRDLVGHLVQLLRLRDPRRITAGMHLWVWTLAAEASGHIGAAARRTIPHLARLLRDQPYSPSSFRSVRITEAAAVAALGAMGRPAVRALARLVADGNTTIRRAAMRSLGRLGPRARPAVTALVRAGREHWYTAEDLLAVIEALAKIGSRSKAAAHLLRRAAAHELPRIRQAAAAAAGAAR